MKNQILLATFLLGPVLGAQSPARDTRPISAYLALPAPGSSLPSFSFITTDGSVITRESLLGSRTVLVFWSTWCGASRRILADVEALAGDAATHGDKVVILADDALPSLRQYADSVGIHTTIASAEDAQKLFDNSATTLERHDKRVEWAIPMVLVADTDGRVAMRDGGLPLGRVMETLTKLRR